MPLWPLPTAAPQASHPMVTTASAWSVNVPTGGTAHTMGAWTELVASTAIDADLLRLRFGGHYSGGAASPALMDIGVGAAGSEVVILPTIDVGGSDVHHHLLFPVAVPAGSRIAARAQGLRTAVNIATTVALFGEMPMWGGQATSKAWTAYGVSAAASGGTQVQPNATANTWGSWTEIATTTADHDWWMVTANTGESDTTVRLVTNLIQVAAAPDAAAASACAANGTLLMETNQLGNSTNELQQQAELPLPRYAPVPSGTKLWARLQTSHATDNDLYVSIYGGS